MTERSIGRANAPMTVLEYFSMTCSHCGNFHRNTYPRVKSELVDTGRIRLVWRDYPLDQVAIRVHAVARTFPAAGYEPFISTLFASQDRWAFARGVDHKAEVGRIAAHGGRHRRGPCRHRERSVRPAGAGFSAAEAANLPG